MVVAIMGSSAVAPPNSTATRSRLIAPSRAGVAKMSLRPAVASRMVGGPDTDSRCAVPTSRDTPSSRMTPTTSITAAHRYGTVLPVACSTPPRKGPTMSAPCQVDDDRAMVRGRSRAATAAASIGENAALANARPAPRPAAMK